MQLTIIMIGKTDKSYLKEGINEYIKRIKKHIKVELNIIPDIKNKQLSQKIRKQKEGELILSRLEKTDYVILLDEKGELKSSLEFARFLQNKMNISVKNLVFIIGGPYGFSHDIYKRSNGVIALSKMTFSHQMVRLILLEQIYRANTIIRGEPYHHE